MKQSYTYAVLFFSLSILKWLGFVYYVTFNTTFSFARDWVYE